MAEKTALFFCSAIAEIKPEYNQAAREVVRAACLAGYGVRSGLTVKGTMKVVSDEAKACGARISGALPSFMKGLEYPGADEIIWTETMAERKEEMRRGTCLAIALPGGIGTIDELSETFCLAKMGIYPGRVIAFNMNGFYEPYKQQLELCVREGMLPRESMALISFPETVEELKELL